MAKLASQPELKEEARMSKQLDRLVVLLKELFQLDQPDLDFGLYRIMHAKADEITQFLEKDLLPQVKDAFSQYTTADKADLENQLKKAIEQANNLGVDPETTAKVKELRRKIADESIDVAALETAVYDHLYSFFRRYYDEGDFLAKRVYKPGVYAIPYEGEEVKLHWANRDQYYIKTSEYLRDYAFTLRPSAVKDPMRVHFRLVGVAEGEHDNVKAAEGRDRVFLLATDDFITLEDGELVLRFRYRAAMMSDWPEAALHAATAAAAKKPPVQKELLADAVKRVLAVNDPAFTPWIDELAKQYVKANGDTADYSRLEGHLNRYVARHTFDYFIHKDLGGFLRRELDFFIKNEVMHLDDVESESAPRVDQYLSKIKVIRKIAHKLIEFLAQLENFQKKLWLKKKFVVDTAYFISLDRIPEDFYPEIAANDAQRVRWVELFAIDNIEDVTIPQYSVPLTLDFLRSQRSLSIDTRLFSVDFTQRVLSAQGDLNASLSGTVIASEATQASRAIAGCLAGSVGIFVADPPYNTGSDGFPYKDSYQHASWLTMMADVLDTIRPAMRDDTLCATFIDDHEMYRLGLLMNDVFGEDNRAACAPWKSEASGGKEKTGLRTGHEYILIYHNGDPTNIAQTEISTGALDREDKLGKYRKGRELRKWGGASSRADRPGQWFALPAPDGTEVFPIKNDGTEGHWRWGKENPAIKRALIDPDVFHWERCSYDAGVSHDGQTDRWVPFEKIRDIKKSVGWSTWLDTIGANADATRELKAMFGKKPFETPKPSSVYRWLISLHSDDDSYVVDLFAGSGTAAQAVIDSNTEESSRRRFIVGDSAGVVDEVIVPRVLKAAYSRSWRDGRPEDRNSGSSLLCKYIALESYEDTLNNLDIRRTSKQRQLLDSPESQGPNGFREQFLLRYMLDVETRAGQSLLNVAAFSDPTAYRLKVKRPGDDQSCDVFVDLLETFNILIGLAVKHIAAPQAFQATFKRDEEKRLRLDGRLRQNEPGPWWFRTVQGVMPDERKALVIWRKLTGDAERDNLVLDEWFTRQGYSTKDYEFDVIFVNGDNNLENLRQPDETWKVRLIEEDFERLMFDVETV